MGDRCPPQEKNIPFCKHLCVSQPTLKLGGKGDVIIIERSTLDPKFFFRSIQQHQKTHHFQRECFFLAGWSHSNHFSSKTESLSFNSPTKQSMRQRLSTFLTRQTTKWYQWAKQFHQRDRRPQWNTLLECWCCIYVAQHLSWNKQSILARASAPEEIEKRTDAPPKIHLEIR